MAPSSGGRGLDDLRAGAHKAKYWAALAAASAALAVVILVVFGDHTSIFGIGLVLFAVFSAVQAVRSTRGRRSGSGADGQG